jgi:hypothetical protein
MARKKDTQNTEPAPAPVETPNPHNEPAEGPAEPHTPEGEQPAGGNEDAPAEDGEPAQGPDEQPPAPDDKPPAPEAMPALGGNAAAPLRPEPTPRGLGRAISPAPAGIIPVIGEGHVGIVDAAGNQVDLNAVLIKETPRGNTYRCTKRLFEETTVPGNDARTRRRVLFGQDQLVDEYRLRELIAQVDGRTAERQAMTTPVEDPAGDPAGEQDPAKEPAKVG